MIRGYILALLIAVSASCASSDKMLANSLEIDNELASLINIIDNNKIALGADYTLIRTKLIKIRSLNYDNIKTLQALIQESSLPVQIQNEIIQVLQRWVKS